MEKKWDINYIKLLAAQKLAEGATENIGEDLH